MGLVASVGVAPNKFLAKIASDLEKPDGLVIVAPERVQEFLDRLPVGRLWGVGKATGGAFERLGIRTIGQLRRLKRETLREQFDVWRAAARRARPVVLAILCSAARLVS